MKKENKGAKTTTKTVPIRQAQGKTPKAGSLRPGSVQAGQDLRKQAEKIVRKKAPHANIDKMSPAQIKRSLHELQVYQIELTTQNEELRRAQEALQIAHDRYFNFYDLAPVGYCTISEKGLILEANVTIATLLGITRSTLIRYPLTPFILKEDRHIYFLHSKQLLETGEQQVSELRMVKKDGAIFWVKLDATAAQDTDGAPVCRIVLSNITDRKQAEGKLRDITQRLQLATSSAKAGVWDWNLQANEMIWDDRMLELYGLTPENFPGGVEAWEQGLHPDDSSRAVEECQAALHGERDFDTEFRVLRPDRTTVHIKANGIVLRDEEGKPLRMIGLNTDITERKRAEEEKFNLEAQLFQSQKMEAIGTLAGGIAHDFNNILAVIIGYAELARDISQKENKEQYLQEVLMGAERARNLVKQILTFSRQDDHEKKSLDIKILLKEAVKFLRSSIPATIEIDQQITKEECNIMADPTQMHQIIMNLCTNAAHAMKEAGGTLKIELTNIELAKDEIPNHPNLQPGHYVKLTVSDTGYGIDPAIVQRVFEPFFTTKSVDEGTGLGLSVVYGIVTGHGGVINVYSEQGKGAAFHVYLPRIIQNETMEVDMDKPVIGGTERILFVDDEPALVDIGLRILFPLGYHVTGATSSMEALNIFSAEPQSFDLVITDMTLPKMTGIDLSREILKIRQYIPIILCSGINDPETEAQAKSLGIKAYLAKPLTRRELAQAIRKVLDGNK